MRHVGPLHRTQRGHRGRHEHPAHADPEQEHVQPEGPQAAVQVAGGQQEQDAGHHAQADGDDQARPDPGIDRARHLDGQQHPERLGEGAGAGRQRAPPLGLLDEQRAEEHRTHDRDHADQADQVGVAEQPVREQPQPQHRLLGAQLDDRRGGQQHRAADERRQHGRRRPALLGALAHPVHQPGQTAGRQQQPGYVQAAGGVVAVRGEEQQAEQGGGDADGQVDVEHPAPGEPVDQDPAEDRCHGRGDLLREDHQPGGADTLLGGEGTEQHRPADGHQQPAGAALERPVGDQLAEAVGRSAQG